MKSLKLIVHGRVHGVFYRQSTLKKATELNLNGTVRNCHDGTVEIIAEGKEEKIAELIKWCHHGPAQARVDQVDIHEQPLKNFTSFTISR